MDQKQQHKSKKLGMVYVGATFGCVHAEGQKRAKQDDCVRVRRVFNSGKRPRNTAKREREEAAIGVWPDTEKSDGVDNRAKTATDARPQRHKGAQTGQRVATGGRTTAEEHGGCGGEMERTERERWDTGGMAHTRRNGTRKRRPGDGRAQQWHQEVLVPTVQHWKGGEIRAKGRSEEEAKEGGQERRAETHTRDTQSATTCGSMCASVAAAMGARDKAMKRLCRRNRAKST